MQEADVTPGRIDLGAAARIAGRALLAGAGTYFTTVAGPASVYEGAAQFRTNYERTFGCAPRSSISATRARALVPAVSRSMPCI